MQTSFQLYSDRNHVSLAASLAALSELGYTRVEGYGGLLNDAQALERGLKDNGLVMPSCHVGIDLLESDPDHVVGIAKRFGIEMIFAPCLEAKQRPGDAAGWQALAKRLATIGSVMFDAGITFGWHNHDFELIPTADGAVPLDELLAHAPNIMWEADLAWVARAGADPVAVAQRHLDRIVAVHVKDIAEPGTCLDEDGWADPGVGVMPWKDVIAALQAAPHKLLYIAEHDLPSDTLRFARQAQSFFAQHGAAS